MYSFNDWGKAVAKPKQAVWQQVPLGRLAELKNGLNFTKENFGKGIKVINVKDFQVYTSPHYDTLEEINPEGLIKPQNLLEEDDILFVRSNGNRALIGRSLYILGLKEKVSHSAFTIRARFYSDAVVPRFYAYLFRSSIFRTILSAYGGGTNISNLNQQILKSLQVPLPPLDVQQKIASILSAYDDLIENNTRRIRILEEMAQSLYREWFVHFRFPGHEKVRLVDSSYGKIPEGWLVKKAGDVLDFHIGGGWGKEQQTDDHPISAYVIRGTDIPATRHATVETCPLRFHKRSNFKTRKLKKGDIVFEVSGGSKGQPVGRALLVNQELLQVFDEPVICASFCKLLRPTPKVLTPELLYLHLIQMYDDGRIRHYQVQSTGITNFKFAYFLENALLLIPNQASQARFSEVIDPILALIQALGVQENNLRRTRDLLLPKLVLGELIAS